jgi:hypothetical protein
MIFVNRLDKKQLRIFVTNHKSIWYKINHFFILYNSTQISDILNANLVGDSNHLIEYLLIDSRQLTEPALTVFIALTSERNDAHQYI